MFGTNGKKKDGTIRYRSQCKSCVAEYDSHRQSNHPNRRHFWKVADVRIQQLKLSAFVESGGCADCGNADIRVLEFDHRPGTTKEFSLGGRGRGVESVKAEITKCDVVCANCHRIRTIERGDHWKSLSSQVKFLETLPDRRTGLPC